MLSAGTTFQGAFDDPQAAWKNLSRIPKQHGLCFQTGSDRRQDFWIHIDGALGAAYLPYLEMAFKQGMTCEKGPGFDFRFPWVSPIVMSSHKWYGAPFASGIYMSREKYRMRPATLPIHRFPGHDLVWQPEWHVCPAFVVCHHHRYPIYAGRNCCQLHEAGCLCI